MSASSVQQTVEKREAGNDVKPKKPPVKPKPTVPPKPQQAYVSKNSEIKSPLLSPNSGGPCSPTFDIPSAFKISQLTGPQPYGARRTSLKRWSSSVGEEVPLESNTILSPVETVVPELSTKITNQPLSANLKPLQTGSVWKGKSPFMLTTRGWGEQKCQGKDVYESASFSQKHSFSSLSKDADFKEKETAPERNAIINSNSPSRFMSTDDKQSFSSVSEEVDKTPVGLTSSGKNKREMPAEDHEMKGSQEMFCPETDVYFGPIKQSTQYEYNRDTKTEDFSYKSGEVTTGSPEDIDGALRQLKNTSLKTKDYEEPQLISLVPTSVPKVNILVTENTDNAEKIEESPLSDTWKSTSHEVTRHHKDHSTDISELRTVVKEERDADSGYVQTPQSQIMVINQNTEQKGKLEQVEKLAISSEDQITDKQVTENKIYENVSFEDKECIESVEHNLLHTAEHCDFHEGKMEAAKEDNNKPYTYQKDKETVALTDMEPSVCKVRSYEIFSEGQQNTHTQIHDYNIGEEKDQFKNRHNGYNATVQCEEYVPHQKSDGFKQQTEYPSEYRSVFGTDVKSCYDYITPTAPELPEHEDNETSSDLYVASQVLENDSLIPGEVYSHLIGESKQPSHSYMETDTQLNKPQEKLNQLESHETSKPELHYDEPDFRYSETTSQEPAARVTKPAELSDHCEQSAKLEYYIAQSPKQNECEVHLDNSECRVYGSHMPQSTHSRSHEQDFGYTHTVEPDDKQSDELVHTHGESQEPDYTYQQLEKLADKCEQSDKPNYMYEQLEENVQRSEMSRESEGSHLKYEQTEGTGLRNQESRVNKYEFLEEPSYQCEKSAEKVLREDQSEEHVFAYKLPDKSVGRYGQSEDLLQSYQQPWTIDQKHQQSEEPIHGYDEAVQRYFPSENLVNKNEQSDESQYKYAYLEETDDKYELVEDSGHENKQFDKPTDTYEQKEQPVCAFQALEEPIQKYETSNEPVSRYEQPEHIIHSHDQSDNPDHVYKQHDEPVYSYDTVNQYGQTEDSGYIQTGSGATNSEFTQLGPLQQQYKPVESEEIDSTLHFSTRSCDKVVECPEKDIKSKEFVEQELNDSYIEDLEYKDTSIDGMHDTEQIPKYPLSEEQQLLNVHKEETQKSLTESEKAQNVEGSSQESPAITTVDSGEGMQEEPQDQKAKITSQILNGHAEHGELQTVDSTSAPDINAEEPEPSIENFDFLEGTVVLDSSFMRGRASLGKKRGHRTPAGACGSEEKDPEYWMFRDSTEAKRFSETHSEEENTDETSPDGPPDNSPSPVKSPNKKGIFAGIISPSLLKGRLKTRSKTTEDETVKPEVEEAKSPGKEKPESSGHSLGWLHALKKKKKSIKETTKEEKKKTPK